MTGSESKFRPKAEIPREVLHQRWASGLLIVLVFACFAPALSAGFVSWDDTDNLVNNTHWRGLAPAQLGWMFTAFHLGHYQPLTWLSYAVDHSVWEMEPAGYHFTN